MTRELKLALIVGFALVLLVAVLISDHLSDARQARLADSSDKPSAYITEPVAPLPARGSGAVRSGPLASSNRSDTPDIIRDVRQEPGSSPLGSAWTVNPLDILHMGSGPVAVNPPAPAPTPAPERSLANANHPAIPTSSTSEDAAVPTITQSTRDNTDSRLASNTEPRTDADESLADRLLQAGYRINNGVIDKIPDMPVAAHVESVTTLSTPTNGATSGGATRVIPIMADPRILPVKAVVNDPKGSPKPEKHDDATYYTIANGDSLYKIAKKFYGNGEEWRKIADANKLSGASNLKVGAKIKIPGVKPSSGLPSIDSILNAKSDKPAPSVAPSPAKDAPKGKPSRPADTRLADLDAKPSKPKPATYVVQSGDTLGDIAKKKLGSSRRAGEIIAMNPDALSDPDDLVVGLAIRLPSR